MVTELVLITHNNIGQALLNTAEQMIGQLPLTVSLVSVSPDCDRDALIKKVKRQADRWSAQAQGIMLTDIFGSTPYHIARSAANQHCKVIAGVNLPMLVRIMNYANLPLDELLEKALSGGHDGIVHCLCKEDDTQHAA